MSQKKMELVNILKNLDQQLTSLKKCLQSGVDVNNLVPNSSYNFLIWATENLENEEILEYLINSGANVNDEHDNYTPLIKAAGERSLNKIKVLLSKGANVNNILSDGDTVLTTTPMENTDLPMVEYLIEQGADVNLIGYGNRTPLSWAVYHQNVEIVRLLIANGAIVNKPDGDGTTPLTIARQEESNAILELLENSTNSTEKSLREAILKNSLTDIETLLDNGANINDIDSEGNTPLQRSILSENISIVKRLIKSKANVCKRGKNGKTPLSTAIETGNSNIVKMLLQNGAEHTIQSALFEAIKLRNLEFVKILIEKGAILDVTYKDGCTPLTKAIGTGDLDIVKVLVENGADVKMPQCDGISPLSLALKKGNLHISQYLINNFGFEQQIKSDSSDNLASLLEHIEDDNLEMVKMLVEMGASLNSIYDDQDTPLSKAVKLENYEIVKYLVKKGADVNQANEEGKVPLAIAATNRDIRIVEFLIRSKARLDLAEEEIEEYVRVDDDLAIYLDLLKKETYCWGCMKKLQHPYQDFGHEAAN